MSLGVTLGESHFNSIFSYYKVTLLMTLTMRLMTITEIVISLIVSVINNVNQGPLYKWTEHSNFPLQGGGTQKPL